jgi:hypothetical protein
VGRVGFSPPGWGVCRGSAAQVPHGPTRSARGDGGGRCGPNPRCRDVWSRGATQPRGDARVPFVAAHQPPRADPLARRLPPVAHYQAQTVRGRESVRCQARVWCQLVLRESGRRGGRQQVPACARRCGRRSSGGRGQCGRTATGLRAVACGESDLASGRVLSSLEGERHGAAARGLGGGEAWRGRDHQRGGSGASTAALRGERGP